MSDTTPATGSGVRPEAASADHRIRDRVVIYLLLVSTFVVILNETIMNVALPVLMRDLRISAGAAQWLSTAFMLTMAVVIPVTGWLLQRFPTRTLFLTAMTLFSSGTLLAALAPGYTVLLCARIVQASGTAIMFPLLITTVMTLVPPALRGRTMGNISIVIAVAPAVGPTLSGLILSVFDWRWMFLFVLPIALTMLTVGAVRMVNITEPRTTHFDVFSVVVSAFGFGGLVYSLSNLGAAASSGSSALGWVSLGVGGAAIAVFILRQLHLQRRDAALLDLRTFRSRTFTAAIIMITISMLALFGTIILLPIYMQNVLGLNTLATGLLLLPGGLIMGLLAPLVGRIYDRIGPTLLLVTGSTIVSAVFWGMARLSQHTPTWGGAGGPHRAQYRPRADLHPSIHLGTRLAQARALLARQCHRGDHPAGGGGGRDGAVRDRDGRAGGVVGCGGCPGVGGPGIRGPGRVPDRRDHLRVCDPDRRIRSEAEGGRTDAGPRFGLTVTPARVLGCEDDSNCGAERITL